MKATIPLLLLAFSLSFLQGCSTSGMLPSVHATAVALALDNYKIVAIGVYGHSKVSNVFGRSSSLGLYSSSSGLIPIGDPRLTAEFKALRDKESTTPAERERCDKLNRMRFNVYQAALDDLWSRFEQKYGKAAGRSLALTNIRFDCRNLNLLFYSTSNLTLTADVIEFQPILPKL
jgi:hypothetical protein